MLRRWMHNLETKAALPLWMMYPPIFAAIYLLHWTLLRLPYFWDEGGYYIPAAWDFYRFATPIPVSTMRNAHPPLPSILLAGWWHLTAFTIYNTRLFVCLIAALALLAVFRIGRTLANDTVALTATVLTAIYPVWFSQSTLAHADIFAACATLWALSIYFEQYGRAQQGPGGNNAQQSGDPQSAILNTIDQAENCHPERSEGPAFATAESVATRPKRGRNNAKAILTFCLFTLSVMAKETAIVTPAALSAWELWHIYKSRNNRAKRSQDVAWFAAIASTVLPLIAWYIYHHAKTGFTFGNPEYLRYNATANTSPARIVLSLWHRLLHLTFHMNLWTATLCTAVVLLMDPLRDRAGEDRRCVTRQAALTMAIIAIANWIAFSILGGALLTRYLLPVFPLLLIAYTALWWQRFRQWWIIALVVLTGFAVAIRINPSYPYAPEDNLAYRDMIVLHQQAIRYVATHYTDPAVLTAWPVAADIIRPELGYTRTKMKMVPLENFSTPEIFKAMGEQEKFDTAIVFSTKYMSPEMEREAARNAMQNLAGTAASDFNSRQVGAREAPVRKDGMASDRKYFDFHDDLLPDDIAHLLHGQVVWKAQRAGEWAAVLRFPRSATGMNEFPKMPGDHSPDMRVPPPSRRSIALR